jgi:hypothetical protein
MMSIPSKIENFIAVYLNFCGCANAAKRYSYSGSLVPRGKKIERQRFLNELPYALTFKSPLFIVGID